VDADGGVVDANVGRVWDLWWLLWNLTVTQYAFSRIEKSGVEHTSTCNIVEPPDGSDTRVAFNEK
jgi:hypothetical protein